MRKILSEIRKSTLFSNVTDEEILNFIQLHPCKLVNYKKMTASSPAKSYPERSVLCLTVPWAYILTASTGDIH